MQGKNPLTGREPQQSPSEASTDDSVELPGPGTETFVYAVDADGDSSVIAHTAEDDGAFLLPHERMLPFDERERLLMARRRPRQNVIQVLHDVERIDDSEDDTTDTDPSTASTANTATDASNSSSGTSGGTRLEAPAEMEFENLKHSADAAREYLEIRKSEAPDTLRAEQIRSSSEPTLSADLRVTEHPLDPHSRDQVAQNLVAQQDPRHAATAVAAAAVVTEAQRQEQAQQQTQQQQVAQLNQQQHPDHALYQRTLQGVTALGNERLNLTGEQQQNVAAALVVKVRETPGFERNASNMTVALGQGTDRVFAVDNPNSVAPRHASVDIAVARDQTVAESSHQLAKLGSPAQLQQTQNTLAQTQETANPEHRGPRHSGP